MEGLLNPESGACILVLMTMISCMSEQRKIPLRVDGELISLKTRPNVRQNFLLVHRKKTSAVVILFPGGQGTLKLKEKSGEVIIPKMKGNFLVRSLDLFTKQGFIVALVDAPITNRTYSLTTPFRMSPDHARDISHVVRYLRRYKRPIWVIGTSRETISSVNIANSVKGLSGPVLTSSVTRENRKESGKIHCSFH